MERAHDFLNAGVIVPPVQIQEIYVARPQLLEGSLDRHM